MRDSFVLIICLLVITVCANLDNDGFNLYKDHLRARSDEPLKLDPEIGRRMLYFYRAPLRLYMDLPPIVPQDYKENVANMYRNYLLNKDSAIETEKRTSKAALSLMLQSKDAGHDDE